MTENRAAGVAAVQAPLRRQPVCFVIPVYNHGDRGAGGGQAQALAIRYLLSMTGQPTDAKTLQK